MNKKGIAEWTILGAAIPAYMCWAAISMVIATVVLTPAYRERKAIAKCETTVGMTHEECVAQVRSWPKAQVLAYLKNNAKSGNGGNFAGGNSN